MLDNELKSEVGVMQAGIPDMLMGGSFGSSSMSPSIGSMPEIPTGGLLIRVRFKTFFFEYLIDKNN